MATVNGTNFQPGAQVLFDGQPASNVVWVSSTQITCSPPAHAAGVVDVKVVNPDGTSGTKVAAYTYGLNTTPPSGYTAWWKVSSLADGSVASWAATGSSPPTLANTGGSAVQPVKSSSPSILTYNGSSEFLVNNTLGAFTAAFTVGTKFRLASVPTGIGDFQCLLELMKIGGGDGMVLAFVPGAAGYGSVTVSGTAPNTGSVFASPTLDTTIDHRLIVTYDGVGANNSPGAYQIFWDGVAQTLTAGSTLLAVTESVLGALNNAGSAANYFHGRHYDIVAYDTVKASGDITNLDLFLQQLP